MSSVRIFSYAAQMSNDGNYKTIRGQALVSLHPNCIFAKFDKPAEWIIFNDITQTKSLQARDVTKVQPLWLLELANHYYSVENFPI
jgi:pre-mRNA-splicing factor ATP-dependent RNA helicase DHX15/PRP43